MGEKAAGHLRIPFGEKSGASAALLLLTLALLGAGCGGEDQATNGDRGMPASSACGIINSSGFASQLDANPESVRMMADSTEPGRLREALYRWYEAREAKRLAELGRATRSFDRFRNSADDSVQVAEATRLESSAALEVRTICRSS